MKAIKRLRGSIGLSQEGLAEKLGVSRNTIAFVESDKCDRVSPGMLKKLCGFFNVKEMELYDDLKSKPQTDEERFDVIMNVFESGEDKDRLKQLITDSLSRS